MDPDGDVLAQPANLDRQEEGGVAMAILPPQHALELVAHAPTRTVVRGDENS